ncbi:MAG: lysophospholipid acyltransferase family protein [bacterium]
MKPPTWRDRCEYLGTRVFVALSRRLPLRVVLALAWALGWLAFDVVRYRRRVALGNLERHLGAADGLPRGARSSRAFRRLGRESVRTFITGLAEFARLPLLGEAWFQTRVSACGLDHLDRALEAGRGAVLVTGHFGSWEVTGKVLVRLGYPVKYLVGAQRNRLVLSLMNRIRLQCGIGVIEQHRLLAAVRALKANQFVAMLSDQDAGAGGVFVDFMGEPASTPRGAARLAILAGAPVIPGFIVTTGPGRHRVVIEPAIRPPGPADQDSVGDLTRAYTRVIESYVRRYPGQWLWTHRRWKTRPS